MILRRVCAGKVKAPTQGASCTRYPRVIGNDLIHLSMPQCPDISGQPNEGCVNESRVCYSLTLNDNTADCTPKRTWCRPSDERIIFTCTDIQNTAPLRTCLNAITDIPTTSMMNMVTDFEFYTLNFTADICKNVSLSLVFHTYPPSLQRPPCSMEFFLVHVSCLLPVPPLPSPSPSLCSCCD